MSVDLRCLSLSERKRDPHRLCRQSRMPLLKQVQTELARVQELLAGPGLRAGMKAAPAWSREGVAGRDHRCCSCHPAPLDYWPLRQMRKDVAVLEREIAGKVTPDPFLAEKRRAA